MNEQLRELPFVVPFIRWADVARIYAGASGPHLRRLYDHEIVLCVGGRGHIVIEGQSYDATPNRLFLVTPHVWHSFRADCDEDLFLLGVHFDWMPQDNTLQFPIFFAVDGMDASNESLIRKTQLVPDWDVATRPFLELPPHSRVRASLEDVVVEYSIGDEESRLRAGALLAATTVLISREARSLAQADELKNVGPDAARRVEKARALLEDIHQNLSVEEVAKRLGWSSDHLRRTFRAVYGLSPSAWQNNVRLQRARHLLRAGDEQVIEVAKMCGFESADYFARWFKEEVGLTPRQFRALTKYSVE